MCIWCFEGFCFGMLCGVVRLVDWWIRCLGLCGFTLSVGVLFRLAFSASDFVVIYVLLFGVEVLIRLLSFYARSGGGHVCVLDRCLGVGGGAGWVGLTGS